ncbi:DUF3142 domain-containing protein [Labrys sp. KNU-23]|uniref:DUF3142 domain-containing protein n=1 Tax=Labrys sp. KNU-23 TaxID=2789216 RepID=UPI0011EE94EC|nr:DUF3142 domain-containing protein [Labrys sp. KNU-23]QEN91165.1 DUF3142 domain-containing protein [Labrys sp. KNU-23]
MLRPVCALAVFLAVAGGGLAAEPPVDIGRYHSFWLWAGVKTQPELARARELYLLGSEVGAQQPVRLLSRRSAVPRLPDTPLWLVVRVETLAWPPEIYGQVLAQLERWRAAGNRVVGLQIDFDARTRHLEGYASFLSGLRRQLPAEYRLGITGLMDWSSNGDPRGLEALGGVVDEVIIQTYQGRRTIPGYAAYLSRLGRLQMPFRIGLVQAGDWQEPPGLVGNPWFRGYVVFLQNPRQH